MKSQILHWQNSLTYIKPQCYQSLYHKFFQWISNSYWPIVAKSPTVVGKNTVPRLYPRLTESISQDILTGDSQHKPVALNLFIWNRIYILYVYICYLDF